MQYFGGIQVINKYGFSKIFDVQKAIILIGSDLSNDIVLSAEQGAGVAPMHLQIIFPRQGSKLCRVVNLSPYNAQVVTGPSNGLILKSHAMHELKHNDCVSLGEFSLTLKIWENRSLTVEERSPSLGLKLQLPSTELLSGKNISGLLTLTNYGKASRCQFRIDIAGIKKDCFQLGPAPFLFPGASEELPIQFIHQGARPLAGRQVISISATASQTYPTEAVQLEFELNVEPVYQFQLDVEDLQPPQVVETVASLPSEQNTTLSPNASVPTQAPVFVELKSVPLSNQSPAPARNAEPSLLQKPTAVVITKAEPKPSSELTSAPVSIYTQIVEETPRPNPGSLPDLFPAPPANTPQEAPISDVSEPWVTAKQVNEVDSFLQSASNPFTLMEQPFANQPAPDRFPPTPALEYDFAANSILPEETAVSNPGPRAAAQIPDEEVELPVLPAQDSRAGETASFVDNLSETESTPAIKNTPAPVPNGQKNGSFLVGGRTIKVIKAGTSLDDEPQELSSARAGGKK
ncbi:MAG: hypothetical protein WCK35_01835 [Chloroflexota bacterium]